MRKKATSLSGIKLQAAKKIDRAQAQMELEDVLKKQIKLSITNGLIADNELERSKRL